ncbi:MAG: Lon protease-like protein [Chlamydiales bacterium]|jgi:Lon protease-like protein
MFPLPQVVLFPRQLMPLHVFEPRYLQMIEDSLDGPGRLIIATIQEGQADIEDTPPAVLPVAGLGEIARHDRLDDGRFLIWVFGLARVRLLEVDSEHSYRLAECEALEETIPSKGDEMRLRPKLVKAIVSRSDKMLKLPPDVPITLLTDLLAQRMHLPQSSMAGIFSEPDTVRRAERAIAAHRKFPPLELPPGDN